MATHENKLALALFRVRVGLKCHIKLRPFLTVPFLYFRVYGQKVSTMVPEVVLPKMDISHLLEGLRSHLVWREVGPGIIFH